jgi:TRAP-type uncharacterized transport system fused permease subunit
VFVIPFLFVFSGTLLMNGNPIMIVIDVLVAIAGVWFGAAGVMGYSVRPLRPLDRALYLGAGLCLLTPLDAFSAGRWINGIGAIVAVAILIRERALRQRAATPPVEPSRTIAAG